MKGKETVMSRSTIFNLSLFAVAAVLSLTAGRVELDSDSFFIGLLLFWVFSLLYEHLRQTTKLGKTVIDYGISYGLAFALFAGPLGVFIYQVIYRISVYLLRKAQKEQRPDSGIHVFYNIGSFTLSNIVGYYLFFALIPYMNTVPFGFWFLILFLIGLTLYLSDFLLLTMLYLDNSIRTRQDAWEFIKDRSILDLWKSGFSNGLLLVFLIERNWELLIGLFMLNYIVSRSFITKSQNMQDKLERNQFEEMAYTDFLTGVGNRTFMNKQMDLPHLYTESFAVVVCDIDAFKKVNDAYNHAVGDTVIIHFAKLLQSHLAEEDFLFRTGGEEFTLFLRGRSFEEAKTLADKMRRDVERSFVIAEFKGDQVSISYTASFGLYYKHFTDHAAIEKGYTHADNLLFESKRAGRNVVIAENEIEVVAI
jgi:diguanylate cyclase (GGDEF)-like protein